MARCMFLAAFVALAFAAGPTSAQVAHSNPPNDKPAVAAVDETPVAQPVAAPPIQVSAVPEPGSVLLLGGPAAVGWVLYWRRKWRAPAGT
jgi:hypothetical protein